MNELEVVNKLKIATIEDVKDILDKNLMSVKRQLRSWAKLGEIKIVLVENHTNKIKNKKYYMTNDIFQDYFN